MKRYALYLEVGKFAKNAHIQLYTIIRLKILIYFKKYLYKYFIYLYVRYSFINILYSFIFIKYKQYNN